MSILTVRPLKLARHDFYTCAILYKFCLLQYGSMVLWSLNFLECFVKSRVLLPSTVVRSNLVVNSDCKRKVSTRIYFFHQHTVSSPSFSIFTPCTSFQHDLSIITEHERYKGMVDDAMAEEEESKMFKVVQGELRTMLEKTWSLQTYLLFLQLVRCYLKQGRCAINEISRLLLPFHDVRTGRLSQNDRFAD